MQQFKEELKNTPGDTSLVPCSVNLKLNREETLSVLDGLKGNLEKESLKDKLTLNTPEVNPAQQTGRSLKAFVFVLNIQGQPLMPCSYSKSKKMVKKGAAKVVKSFPLTIQLNFECENKKQETNLGLDSGYENIGFSVTTEKRELISGTLVLDGRTKERLDEKRMYRRMRRNKLWYRQPRFDNRTRKEGWLPPSVERRYNAHLSLITKLKKLIPISNITVEVGKFDIQKIENPDISGVEYQQGSLYEYQNMRSYLMAREKGKCQICKKDFKNKPSHIHHIKPRSEGGNNRHNNLAVLHEKCHKEIHEKHLVFKLSSSSKNYKTSTFMSVVNKRFSKDIPDIKITYGYITFVDRNILGLEKTHSNDAFVISGSKNQERSKSIEIKQVHRNNRVLQMNRKGFKFSIKNSKSKVNPYDIFWIKDKRYICRGMFNKGTFITYGSTKKKEYFKFSEVTKIFHFGSFVWES